MYYSLTVAVIAIEVPGGVGVEGSSVRACVAVTNNVTLVDNVSVEVASEDNTTSGM